MSAKSQTSIFPKSSTHRFDLYNKIFPVNLACHGVSKSVKNKMLHWAQSAKTRMSITPTHTIQSFDRHSESISVTEPVNLASQHQHDASKTIINPSDSETQINIENEEIEIERLDNGYQVVKLVNVALQIQAASQLQNKSNSAYQAVQKKVASLQHEMSNSDNPAILKREIVPENIDADENQIRIQNQICIQVIKDRDDDINRMYKGITPTRIICLFFSLVAVIVLFVGSKALISGPTPCIDVIIGDGVCDDKQNVAECNYDRQDCCLLSVNTTFCEECRCHLGKFSKQSRRQLFQKVILDSNAKITI
jgi:hypothetical protein